MSDLPSGWQAIDPTPAAPPVPQHSDLPEGWEVVEPTAVEAPGLPEPDRPDEVHAKAKIAETLSARSDQSFEAIASSTDQIGELWTGQRVPATNLWQRVRNSFDGLKIQGELDDLSGKQYLGDASPETEARIKDLQGQQRALGPALGNVPKFIAGMAYQLGYQGYHAAGTVVDTALSVLSGEAQTGQSASIPQHTFWTWRKGSPRRYSARLWAGRIEASSTAA